MPSVHPPFRADPPVSRLVAGTALCVMFFVCVFNFAMNMHHSSGLPYWDDWQYFFGTAQGLHVPLTLKSLIAKEADYIAPVIRVVGHVIWQVVGANFLVLRFIGWALFGLMLVIYFRVLLRFAPDGHWAAAIAGLALVSTASVEYFYFQYMALSQPLFFILLFAYLHLMAVGRVIPALFVLVLFGSFGIFGSSYVLGSVGYSVALALAAWPQRGFAALREPRVLVAVPVGVALTAGIGYLTFAGSYANHTGQALVGPWTVDFWIFLFSAFAAAFGFPHDMPTRYFLPLGAVGLLVFAAPLLLMLRRPWSDQRASAEFILGSLLAGTIAVTMVTGVGRAHFCGTDLAGLKACGATPRYVYPIVLMLPAAVLAVVLAMPARRLAKPAAALAVLAVIAAGYGLDRNARPSLARWTFSPFDRMMVERDALARSCLADYLMQALPAQAGAAPDWSRPLVCSSMWTANNLTPFLKVAYETGAPFLAPIVAGLEERRRQPSLPALLASAGLTGGDRPLRIDLPPASGEIAGNVDRLHELKDGTVAVSGWAADVQGREPVSTVLVMVDGHVAATGSPGFERPDVVAALGEPRLKHTGFVIPLGRPVAEGAAVRVFAVLRSFKVAELTGAVVRAAAEPRAGSTAPGGSRIVPATEVTGYIDGRPAAFRRLDAQDQGVVLRHGNGPGRSDVYGARDAWVFRSGDTVYMHYDAAGPTGWLAALATSRDGVRFETQGPILDLGRPGEGDSASASYGTAYFDGRTWHMFYLGTPNVTPPPDRVPAFPYLTMKAQSASPAGPWVKQPGVVPFRPKPGSYYSDTASPGQILRHGNDYLQVFSAAAPRAGGGTARTLGIARTRDLNGSWTIDPEPILPPAEQVENSSLYFQESTGTWFLFTNHVGIRDGREFTDAIWVYWSQDPERWNPENKAVVLDHRNARWSKTIVGLPSVVRVGDRLAVYYDGLSAENAQDDAFGHMRRDIGVAWLDLPIALPASGPGPRAEPRLLDRFEAVERRLPASVADAGPLPDAQCHVDAVAQGAPGSGILNVSGWTVLSGKQGTVPESVLLTLISETGEQVYVRTRREARPDVKAHFGRPAMADPGFSSTADLKGLRGAYRLDVLQTRGGSLHPCGIVQPVIFE